MQNTCTFYSIRSTGQFCVIEAREVSCCCESCVEHNGENCLNQAYASKWNVYTQVRQFLRKILGTCIGVTIRSQMKVMLKEMLPMLKVTVPDMLYQSETNMKDLPKADDTSLSLSLQEVYANINQCANVSELQDYIDTLNDEELPNLEKPILQARHDAKVDKVAFSSLPKDAPVGLFPFETTGDGNCFP